MQEKWNWCMTGWLCGNVSSLMFSMMTESMLSTTRGWRRKIKAPIEPGPSLEKVLGAKSRWLGR
jgi:hypothetical protein